MSSDPCISLPEAVKKVSQALGKDIATKQFLYWTIKHDISAYCKTGNMPIILAAKPFCKIDPPTSKKSILKTVASVISPHLVLMNAALNAKNIEDDYYIEYQRDYSKKLEMKLLWSVLYADKSASIAWPLIAINPCNIRLSVTFSKKLYAEYRKIEIEGGTSGSKIKIHAILGDYFDQIIPVENSSDGFPKLFKDLLSLDCRGVDQENLVGELSRRSQYIVPSVYGSCESEGWSQFLHLGVDDVYFDMNDIIPHLMEGGIDAIVDDYDQWIIDEAEQKSTRNSEIGFYRQHPESESNKVIDSLNEEKKLDLYSSGHKNSVSCEDGDESDADVLYNNVFKIGGHLREDFDEFPLLCILKDFLRLRNGDYKISGILGGDSWESFTALKVKERTPEICRHYCIEEVNADHIWRIVVGKRKQVKNRINLIPYLKKIKNILWEGSATTIRNTWFIQGNDYRKNLSSNVAGLNVTKQQWSALITVFKPQECTNSSKKKITDKTAIELKLQVERILGDVFLDNLSHEV